MTLELPERPVPRRNVSEFTTDSIPPVDECADPQSSTDVAGLTHAETNPLVSIVIPCHNHSAYVGAAITSALGQSYPHVEVIVVDDGSTDDSWRVVSQYAVRLIRQRNGGAAMAVNVGVAAARGEYAVRLDADDLLVPEYVELLVNALRADRSAVFAFPRILRFGALEGEYPTQPFDPDALAERNYVVASAMVRRDAYLDVGGLDPTLPRCEDWDLWLSLVEHGYRGVWVPETALLYRQHASVSRNTRRVVSLAGLRRELQMADCLQRNHPQLLGPAALWRRLARLPRRLVQREVSPPFAALLVLFYGAMLAQRALRLAPLRT